MVMMMMIRIVMMMMIRDDLDKDNASLIVSVSPT